MGIRPLNGLRWGLGRFNDPLIVLPASPIPAQFCSVGAARRIGLDKDGKCCGGFML
jgi:hypothetical protein